MHLGTFLKDALLSNSRWQSTKTWIIMGIYSKKIVEIFSGTLLMFLWPSKNSKLWHFPPTFSHYLTTKKFDRKSSVEQRWYPRTQFALLFVIWSYINGFKSELIFAKILLIKEWILTNLSKSTSFIIQLFFATTVTWDSVLLHLSKNRERRNSMTSTCC